jgi:hypothetical protein
MPQKYYTLEELLDMERKRLAAQGDQPETTTPTIPTVQPDGQTPPKIAPGWPWEKGYSLKQDITSLPSTIGKAGQDVWGTANQEAGNIVQGLINLLGPNSTGYGDILEPTGPFGPLRPRVTPKPAPTNPMSEALYKEAEEHTKKGLPQGFGKRIFSSAGRVATDLPLMMALGPGGMPGVGAVSGAAASPVEAAKGFAGGLMGQKVIEGIGQLPTLARGPAAFTTGTVAGGGDPAEGVLFWALQKTGPQGEYLSAKDFKTNWNRTPTEAIKAVQDKDALKLLDILVRGKVDRKVVVKEGGPSKVLQKVISEMEHQPAEGFTEWWGKKLTDLTGKMKVPEVGGTTRLESMVEQPLPWMKEGFGAPEGKTPAEIARAKIQSDIAASRGLVEGRPPLPEKAGSINLSKLDTSYDAKLVINELSGVVESMRKERGTAKPQSIQDIMDISKLVDLPKEEIVRRFSQKTKDLGSYATASRMVVDAQAQRVAETAAEYMKNSTPENQAKAVMELQKSAIVDLAVGEGISDSARMLRAQREMVRADQAFKQGNYSEVLKILKKLTPNQDLILKGMAIAKDHSPIELAQYIHDLTKPTKSERATLIYYNWILSGPKTHIRNIVGNTIGLILKPVTTTGAAALDFVESAGGLLRPRSVFFGEAWAETMGAFHGLQNGLRRGLDALKTGVTPYDVSKLEGIRGELIHGKKGAVQPLRWLIAMDEFYKGVISQSEMWRQAYNEAYSDKRLSHKQRAELITERLAHPTESMWQAAEKEATYRTYQSELGKVGKSVQKMIMDHPAMRLIAPFVKTPLNLTKFAAQHTPFNIPLAARKYGKGKLTTAEYMREQSKGLIGTFILAGVVDGALRGNVTGGWPTDQKEKEQWIREGKQPYSIKTGGNWTSYLPLEPVSSIIGAGADVVQKIKAYNKEERKNIENLIQSFISAVSANLTNKTFVAGFADFLGAIAPGADAQPFQKWTGRMAGTIVPPPVAEIARSTDVTRRDVRGIPEAVKSRIPGVRETIPAYVDVVKGKIPETGTPLERSINPFYRSKIREDDIDKELKRVNYYPSRPNREIGKWYLSPKEYETYLLILQKNFRERLESVISDKTYQNIKEDEVRRKILESLRESAGKAAIAEMKMKFPHKLQTIYEEK